MTPDEIDREAQRRADEAMLSIAAAQRDPRYEPLTVERMNALLVRVNEGGDLGELTEGEQFYVDNLRAEMKRTGLVYSPHPE